MLAISGNVVNISLSEQFIHASVSDNQMADFPCFMATGITVMSHWRHHDPSLTTSLLTRPAATNKWADARSKLGQDQGAALHYVLWSEAVACLLTNGSTAFICNLHCYWLVGLRQRQITEVTRGPGLINAIWSCLESISHLSTSLKWWDAVASLLAKTNADTAFNATWRCRKPSESMGL